MVGFSFFGIGENIDNLDLTLPLVKRLADTLQIINGNLRAR